MVLEIASKLISAIAAAFADIRLFGSSAVYILNRLQPSLSPRSPRQTTPALVYQRLDCKGDPLKTSIKHALVPTAFGCEQKTKITFREERNISCKCFIYLFFLTRCGVREMCHSLWRYLRRLEWCDAKFMVHCVAPSAFGVQNAADFLAFQTVNCIHKFSLE